MWRKSENSNEVKPLAVEKGATPNLVYVRRNFKLIPAVEDEHNHRPAHWEYEENTVDVDKYDMYEDLQDMKDAIVELAGIVG